MLRFRFFALTAVIALTATSCAMYEFAKETRAAGGPVPWWCDPSEEIPVTEGPASGTVDWYADVDKEALSWDECEKLSAQLDIARVYAEQWPTAADAVADGWVVTTPYVSGMGTHHVRGGLTAAQLNDPSFDKNNPNLDAAGLDDVFQIDKPEVLQFDGNGPTAKLVGFDYYVRTDTGLPPEGFVGDNDWWHHHPRICFRRTDAYMVGFNTSDASCTSMNGINVNMSNYYMLHVWVLPDMTFEPDVYAGMIPCISGGTAIHDPDHPCHTSRGGAGAMAAHDMTPEEHEAHLAGG